MFKIYYDKGVNGFLHENIAPTIPNTAVEISVSKYKELRQGQLDGKVLSCDEDGNPILVEKTVTQEEIFLAERSWRDVELDRADEELNKVQDSDPKARGTVSQWRDYRKALRAWPENPDFPEKSLRPKAPDYKE